MLWLSVVWTQIRCHFYWFGDINTSWMGSCLVRKVLACHMDQLGSGRVDFPRAAAELREDIQRYCTVEASQLWPGPPICVRKNLRYVSYYGFSPSSKVVYVKCCVSSVSWNKTDMLCKGMSLGLWSTRFWSSFSSGSESRKFLNDSSFKG